jgi:hypothetical protein
MKLGTIKAFQAKDKDGQPLVKDGKPVLQKGRYSFFIPVPEGETRTITVTRNTRISAKTPSEFYGDLLKYAKTEEKKEEIRKQLAEVDPSVQLIVDMYEAKS